MPLAPPRGGVRVARTPSIAGDGKEVFSLTKRIASLAVAAAAVSALALPAAPASAACNWTFVDDCVREILAGAVSPICIEPSTLAPICLT